MAYLGYVEVGNPVRCLCFWLTKCLVYLLLCLKNDILMCSVGFWFYRSCFCV